MAVKLLGGAAMLAAKQAILMSALAVSMLECSLISSAVSTVASGVSYFDGTAVWNWDNAAQGFVDGVVYGAISGAVGTVTGTIGSGLKPRSYILLQSGVGAATSAGISVFQQMATTGNVSWEYVGISAGFGLVASSFAASVKLGKIANSLISFTFAVGQALIEESIEQQKSKEESNIVPNAQMQCAY